MTQEEFDKIEVRGDLFQVDALGYLGVYVEQDLMKKLVKIQHEYTQKIRDMIMLNKDQCLTACWTLNSEQSRKNHPQTTVRCMDANFSVDARIKVFKHLLPRVERVEVVMVDGMGKAEEWIDFKLEHEQ